MLCISLLCTLLFIEGGARIYDRLVPPPVSLVEFRKRQPPPYQNAPYFSQEFLTESFEQPRKWHYPQGTRLIIPSDYHGKYFNVVNGLRVTAYQPKDYTNTVYVFGGSTIYCSEVPDEYTVTSQLQLLFNKHYGSRYIVQNYGTTTVTTTQQLERLRTVSLKPHDIVVFYDGVNDVFQGVYYANPEETMVETTRRTLQNLSPLQKILVRLASYSVFVRRWANPLGANRIPLHLENEHEINLLVDLLEKRYEENLLAAHQYARASNAFFFHFLQPNIYTLPTLSEYEKTVVSNYNLFAPPGMEIAFQKGYPRLRKVNALLSTAHLVDSYDLTHILDSREHGEEFYLDTCHVTHKANQIIAHHIFSKIDAKLRDLHNLPPSSSSQGE